MVRELSEKELICIRNLIEVMDKNDRKLKHPIATLKMMMAIDPTLKMAENIFPWIEAQDEGTLSIKGIVAQLLMYFGIKEDKTDEAIDAIRSL